MLARSARLFYSYSHKDAPLRDELEKHLALLKRQGIIESWHDHCIAPGEDREAVLDRHLDEADLVLLLVSPDFMASDYCFDVQMKRALQRHQAGETHIVPILVRPVGWREAPFGKLQVLPGDLRPVTVWTNQDQAWLDVAQGIKEVVQQIARRRMPGAGPAGLAPPHAATPATGTPAVSDQLPVPALPSVGKILGSYRILREIGSGGMGVVFEAIHVHIERRVAVKVMSLELSGDPGFAARFLDEARAVDQVRHPGLVQIFEYAIAPDGLAYIVMELLEGETLWQRDCRLRTAGSSQTLVDSLRITKRIASALQAVHDKGIIHRDLKPENVMLVPDPEHPGEERVKVLDFGIAKPTAIRRHARTPQGVVLGNAYYMSPEQCRGAKEITGKADVYALGCMLFEMLTGALPFDADTQSLIMVKKVFAPPPSLLALRPDLGPELADLCARMLAREPSERPGMAMVADQAAQLLESAESVLRMMTQTRRRRALPATMPGRRALRAVVLGTLAILSLICLYLWWPR